MSRADYSDDLDPRDLAMWRGQVASAIRGKRGQAFLREMLVALDALPHKRLISEDLQRHGEVCAIGSVGVKRGVDLKPIDPHDHHTLAGKFGIAHQLVREIEYENDEVGPSRETPEHRWQRIRAWVVANIKPEPEKTK